MIRTNIEDIYNTNEEPNKIDFGIERNKIYFERRKELELMINSINSYINKSSKSLFLALYFMDFIFTNNNLENIFFSHFHNLDNIIPLKDIQMNNYALLSVACLIIAYKFNEDNPKLPSMSSLVKLLYHFSKSKFIFSVKDMKMAEVITAKLLNYKLNYYTIYDFFVFFFTHGIIFKKTLQRSLLFEKISERKILEKIYIQARDILDWIIASEEYYNYFFGKDNHIIVVEILLWSIEHILGFRIQENENIFKLIYNIQISKEKQLKIYEIIEKLYILKKCNINKNNKDTFVKKNYSEKTIANSPSYFSHIINKKNNNYNQNTFQNSNINTTVSSNNICNKLSSYEDSFSVYKNLANYDIKKVASIYSYQYTVPNKPSSFSIDKINTNEIPRITRKKNKRLIYNSNKNFSSSYNICSIIPISSRNIQTLSNNLEFQKSENETTIEKEPTDNDKKKSNLKKNDNNQNIDLVDFQRKKILIDDFSKIKKKSLSCTKEANACINSINNFNNNFQINPFCIGINKNNKNIFDFNNEDELKFKEKINKPKIFDNKNKININKYLYEFNSNEPIGKTVPKKEKKTLFKIYQQTTNENNTKKLNKNKKPTNKKILKSKIISPEELINKSNTFFTVTKINQVLENEPKDNEKKRIHKLKNEDENNSIYINSISKIDNHNTIIINNNLYINAYINNNKAIKPISKNNSKIFMFGKKIDNKSVNQLSNLSNSNNRYKKINNKQKLIYEMKNKQELNNKSYNLINGFNNMNSFNYTNKF